MLRKTLLACGILAGQGIHVFGFSERITIGSYEVWILATALKLVQTEMSKFGEASKMTAKLSPSHLKMSS